ncbi:MAG: alpha-2-macroglobulin family protein [Oligosphaeraceae bacterium]
MRVLWGVVLVVLGISLAGNLLWLKEGRGGKPRGAEVPVAPPESPAPVAGLEGLPPSLAQDPMFADAFEAAAAGTPLRIQSAEVDEDCGGISLMLSRSVPELQGEDLVIQPGLPAAPRVLDFGQGLVYVTGQFQPSTLYTIQLKDGEEEAVAVVETPRRPSRARFRTSGSQFPLSSPFWNLPLTTENLQGELLVKVYSPYPNQLLAFLDNPRDTSLSRRVATCRFPVESPENIPQNLSLELEQAGIPRQAGIYYVTIQDSQGPDYRKNGRMVLVSDLGVTATAYGEEMAVGVRSLVDGRSVPQAQVQLWSAKKQLLAEGTTDDQGIARITLPPMADETDAPRHVLVRSAGDLAYCDIFQAPGKPEPLGCFLFGDRGLCRPGENIRFHALMRRKDGRSVAGMPVEFTLLDNRGKALESRKATVDEGGFCQAEFSLPAQVALGQYGVTLHCPGESATVLARESFLVSEALPQQIRLTLEGRDAGKEATLALGGRAAFYYGSPLRDRECTLNVRGTDGVFRPRGFEEFSFGFPGGEHTKLRLQTTSRLDDQGDYAVELPLGDTGNFVGNPVEYQVEATCFPGDGMRPVTAGTVVRRHYAEWYLGGWKGDHPTGRCALRLAAVSPEGKELPMPADLTCRLFRQEWNYVLRSQRDGSLSREWEKREAEVLRGAVALEEGWFLLPENVAPGEYRLEIRDGQGRGRLQMEFWHGAGAGRRLRDPRALVFTLDKEKYLPGETATLSFQAPGAGEGMVVAGGEGLSSAAAFPVKQGENLVQVAIPPDALRGTWYAHVTVAIRENPESDPRLLAGLVELPVNQDSHRLKVQWESPEQARPGEQVTLAVHLRDAQGGPASGEAVLWGVEEGALALTGFVTPDPFAFFHGPQRREPGFFHSYGLLYPILNAGTEHIGGGAALAARFASSLEEAARKVALVYLGTVQVPESGDASLQVTLPEHVGTLRLMAVAAGEAGVGRGEAEMLLRRDLTLQVHGPRVVAPGDRLNVVFQMENHRLPAGTGQWKVEVEGGTLETPASGQVAMEPGKAARASVAATAGEGERLRLRVTLSLGDATEVGEYAVVVRPAVPVQDVVESVSLAPGEAREFAVERWGALEAGTTALAITGSLKWLGEYPYGCLEQMVSTAFPLLGVEKMEAQGLVPSLYARAARQKIQGVLLDLGTKRCQNGWLSMWSGGKLVWEDGSLYAYLFLLEAEKRGYPLAREWRRQIVENLKRTLNQTGGDPGKRAMATLVLAWAEPRSVEAYGHLLPEESCDAFGKFLKGVALMKGGQAAQGKLLLDKALEETGNWLGKGQEAYTGLDSSVRRLGMGLWLLCQVLPDDARIPALTETLLAARNPEGHWGSTQENAWAALGLSAALRGQAQGNFAVEWKEVSAATPETSRLPLSLQKEGRYLLRNVGEVPVRVAVRSRKAASRESEAVSQGLSVHREFRNEKGEVVTSFRPGQRLQVCLQVRVLNPEAGSYVLCDLLPGALEIEDEQLLTSSRLQEPMPGNGAAVKFHRMERRFDRFLGFGDSADGDLEACYWVRVVSSGSYAMPPVTVESMYRPALRASEPPASARIVVEEAP